MQVAGVLISTALQCGDLVVKILTLNDHLDLTLIEPCHRKHDNQDDELY